MIECGEVYAALVRAGARFFTGVPDSLLKDFCAYVADHAEAGMHVGAANEGGAIALAAGHHLATGGLGVVYLQNSGLGNAINPLVSLAHPEVYGIPMLLLIGWRGEPGVRDEPQHRVQGRITLPLLELAGVGYEILPTGAEVASCVERAVGQARESSAPFALVARAGRFAPHRPKRTRADPHPLRREEALRIVLDEVDGSAVLVSTTGQLSRELFEHRAAQSQGGVRDFLTIGSMGHASQIALGIALARPSRPVVCLDGDGALLMHMGSLAVVGSTAPPNFGHVVFNNGAHDSVGGQPTAGFDIDVPAVARACGYRFAAGAANAAEVREGVRALAGREGPALLEIRIARGARGDLGRPNATPSEIKAAVANWIRA